MKNVAEKELMYLDFLLYRIVCFHKSLVTLFDLIE
jgi:hypothetical protein